MLSYRSSGDVDGINAVLLPTGHVESYDSADRI